MRFSSFRVAPSSLAAVILAATILTGCGGSSANQPPAQVVNGPGFTFSAPAGWKLAVGAQRASASHADQLVQVATFPLLKPYRAVLFDRVEAELRTRMRQLAAQTGGTLAGNATVTAAGIRSHAYTVTVGDHVDEYTFVLRGLREYQLLCRRAASAADDVCAQLVASFKTV